MAINSYLPYECKYLKKYFVQIRDKVQSNNSNRINNEDRSGRKIKIDVRINLGQNDPMTSKNEQPLLSDKYYLRNPGLGSAHRAWKNIPKSYLNVWNQKLETVEK